jgi:hypothetical protein
VRGGAVPEGVFTTGGAPPPLHAAATASRQSRAQVAAGVRPRELKALKKAKDTLKLHARENCLNIIRQKQKGKRQK